MSTTPNDVLINLTSVPNASPIGTSKIPRVPQWIAASGSQVGVWGSAAAGTPTLTTDIETVQSLPGFLIGISAMTIGGSKLPPLEEMDGLNRDITQQLAEIYQDGIPPWEVTTPYYVGSIASDGNGNIYISTSGVNGTPNVGNALTSTANWLLLFTSNLYAKTNASLLTGLLQPENEIFTVTVSGTVITIGTINVAGIFFKSLASQGLPAVIKPALTTFDVTSINFTSPGIYKGFIVFNSSGVVSFQQSLIPQTADYCRIASCVIVATSTSGSANSIFPNSVVIMPYDAGSSQEIRAVGFKAVQGSVVTQNANLTIGINNFTLFGECINYKNDRSVINRDVLTLANSASISFYRVSPLNNTSAIVPTLQTTVDPVNYYNGVGIVAVPNNNASTQRLSVLITGTFIMEYAQSTTTGGSQAVNLTTEYSTYPDKVITPVFAFGSSIAVIFVSLTFNTTALNNNAQALWGNFNNVTTGGTAVPTHNSLAGVQMSPTIAGADDGNRYHLNGNQDANLANLLTVTIGSTLITWNATQVANPPTGSATNAGFGVMLSKTGNRVTFVGTLNTGNASTGLIQLATAFPANFMPALRYFVENGVGSTVPPTGVLVMPITMLCWNAGNSGANILTQAWLGNDGTLYANFSSGQSDITTFNCSWDTV